MAGPGHPHVSQAGKRESVNIKEVESHFRSILELLGVDLQDENTRNSPKRIAKAWAYFTRGLGVSGLKKLTTTFQKACKDGRECKNMISLSMAISQARALTTS